MRPALLLAGAALCAVSSYASPHALIASSAPDDCAFAAEVITITVTAPAATVSPQDSSSASLPTLTSYSTMTRYITVYPHVPASAFASSLDDSAFYYAVVNGATSWVNAVAPPSTYETRITKAIQITVYPTAAATSIQYVSLGNSSGNGHEPSVAMPPSTFIWNPATTHIDEPSTRRTITVPSITVNETSYASLPLGGPQSSMEAGFQTSSILDSSGQRGPRPTGFVASAVSSRSLISTSSRVRSSTLSKVFTNTTMASAPTPSVCGEHGDFVLNWDDEPNFAPVDPITDPSDAPPVFNPYHHMYFSNGYVYVPPPRDPFPPVSEPRLVMFLTNETGPSNNPDAGAEHTGEIGAGDRASESAFWFNAYSAYLGCDNDGPDDCTMQISGYRWNEEARSEVLFSQQNATLPACPGYQNCKLQRVDFGMPMEGLSGIRIQAFVDDEQRMWYMDDLAMGWYNNTCAAGLLRIRSN